MYMYTYMFPYPVGLVPGPRNDRNIVNSRSAFDDDSRSMPFENKLSVFEKLGIFHVRLLSQFHELIPCPRPFRRRSAGQLPVRHFGFFFFWGGGGGGALRWFGAVLLSVLLS